MEDLSLKSQGNLSRNPTHSSSSTEWEQHDDWTSSKIWNSWRSASWTEQSCFFFVQRCFFACWKVNSLAIDGRCRQIHLPHATFSHVQSLHRSHSTDDMCAWLKGLDKLKTNCVPKTFTHPRVMFHLAPHSTLNTSASTLSLTSPVLHSSASPTPDLLSTHPFTHCEDPRQDGTLRNTNISQVMNPKGSS